MEVNKNNSENEDERSCQIHVGKTLLVGSLPLMLFCQKFQISDNIVLNLLLPEHFFCVCLKILISVLTGSNYQVIKGNQMPELVKM